MGASAYKSHQNRLRGGEPPEPPAPTPVVGGMGGGAFVWDTPTPAAVEGHLRGEFVLSMSVRAVQGVHGELSVSFVLGASFEAHTLEGRDLEDYRIQRREDEELIEGAF